MQTKDSNIESAAEILKVLVAQWPGRVSLTRTETAQTLGYRNAITVDRLRQRQLLKPNLATRRPTFTLPAIAEFLAATR